MNKLFIAALSLRFCSVNRRFQEGKLVDPRQVPYPKLQSVHT